MLHESKPRPTGIMVLSFLNALQGVWLLAVGSMFAGLGVIGLFTIDPTAVGGYSVLYGLLIAAVGVLHIAVAYGLYSFLRWGWLGAILVNAASLLLAIGSYAFTGQAPLLVSLVVPLVCIWYLLRRDIREAYAR